MQKKFAKAIKTACGAKILLVHSHLSQVRLNENETKKNGPREKRGKRFISVIRDFFLRV